jgi:hypothetical protein
MQVRGDPPHAPGVFIIVRDDPEKVAFVGSTADLRHRATIWTYNFKKARANSDFKLPVKGMSDFPIDGWHFAGWEKIDEGQVRDFLTTHGYRVLNKSTRHRGTITYKGKVATFAHHCRDAGVSYETAYARWRRGKPLEEVFQP